MGNNMVPYAIIVGEMYTYFLYNRYKFIENDKIEEGGKDAFKKLEHTQIHTYWPGVGEDEENEDDDLFEEDEDKEDLNETI